MRVICVVISAQQSPTMYTDQLINCLYYTLPRSCNIRQYVRMYDTYVDVRMHECMHTEKKL